MKQSLLYVFMFSFSKDRAFVHCETEIISNRTFNMTSKIEFKLDSALLKSNQIFSLLPDPQVESVNPKKGFLR